jgi:hypothetical protein
VTGVRAKTENQSIFIRLVAGLFPASRHVSPADQSQHRLFWQFQIGGWLLFMPLATGFALVAVTNPAQIVLTGVIRQIVSFGMTLALWRVYRRWPAETFRLAPHSAQIAFACVVVTALDAFLMEMIRWGVHSESASKLTNSPGSSLLSIADRTQVGGHEYDVVTSAVPEPATSTVLAGSAVLGLACLRRRRRRRNA